MQKDYTKSILYAALDTCSGFNVEVPVLKHYCNFYIVGIIKWDFQKICIDLERSHQIMTWKGGQ